MLTPAELARATRLSSRTQRLRWLASRVFLRELLGELLDLAPHRLELGTGDHGKPYVLGEPGLQFSLSHSAGFAVAAVAVGREVGVDLERLRPIHHAELRAATFLSASDRLPLDLSPSSSSRGYHFLRVWVTLEAMAKAWGRGVGGIEEAACRVTPGELMRPRFATDSDGRLWSVVGVPAPDGYVAAVAAEGSGWDVRTLSSRDPTRPPPKGALSSDLDCPCAVEGLPATRTAIWPLGRKVDPDDVPPSAS